MRRGRRGKKEHNSQSFIEKLVLMLEDEECTEFIRWTADEESFIIEDINKFTQHVLPKYFKHQNFSSFVRQLNMYGFSKIRHQEGDNVYKNQLFHRHGQEEMKSIKRRSHPSDDRDHQIVVYQPENPLNKQLNSIKNKQNNLELMCQQLIAQNSKILEENNRIMKEISVKQKEKNTKVEQLLLSLILAQNGGQISLPSTNEQPMLSLTSNDDGNSSENSGTSVDLEALRDLLEDQAGRSRVQELIRAYQNQSRKKKNSKNYTIVSNKQKEQQHLKEQNEPHFEERDRSLYSLSDFLNMENSQEVPYEPIE